MIDDSFWVRDTSLLCLSIVRASGPHGERSKFFLPDPRDLTDVTLVTDDRVALEAQKLILAATMSIPFPSRWFEKLLTS